MAYTQKPRTGRIGRSNGESFALKGLITPLKFHKGVAHKKKKVKKYDVSTGKTNEIDVIEGSGSDRAAADYGNVVDFGKSVSQKKSTTTGKLREGTNTNVMASASTFGKLPKGYKGRAFDKSNKIVDFSNSNQDKRRGEMFRIYK